MNNEAQRVEGETELNCDADKFFEVWAMKPYMVSQLCPHKYPKVELNEGQWNKVGARITWTYVFNEIGEHGYVKTGIEELDEEKRVVKYSYHDGLILKTFYKTLSSMIQIASKDNAEEGCIVKWSFQYEKKNELVPDPKLYIDYLLGVAKDIDACL